MIRKTALLTGIAGAFLIAAPVFAQDATTPQTPEPATAEAAPAQPQSLTLTPGAVVKSADGSELGKLVGARNGASGQELTVRGADGAVLAEAQTDWVFLDFQKGRPVSIPKEVVDAYVAVPEDEERNIQ